MTRPFRPRFPAYCSRVLALKAIGMLVICGCVGVPAAPAQASEHYRLAVAFSSYAMLDRNATAACQNRGFLTKSSSIVHFSETSVRVATPRQIRTRLPLTSPIYFLRYEGTSGCKVYVPQQ